MTLVPIIYTSLIIFASLLFTVIIISYLSFKLRSRHGKSPSERVGTVNEIIISKPIVMHGPKLNVKLIPARLDNSKQKYNDQVILRERKNRKENLSYTQISSRKDYSRNRHEENKSNRSNNRTNLRATRLEIMNESNSFRKTLESSSALDHQNYNRDKMVEANLFSYYDNNAESDFVLMNTTLLRQA